MVLSFRVRKKNNRYNEEKLVMLNACVCEPITVKTLAFASPPQILLFAFFEFAKKTTLIIERKRNHLSTDG